MATYQLVASLLFMISLTSNHPQIHGFYLHDQNSNEDIGQNEIGDEIAPVIDMADHSFKSRREDPMQEIYSNNPPYATFLHGKKTKPRHNLSLPLFDEPEDIFSGQDGDSIPREGHPHRVMVPALSFRVRHSPDGCHIVSATHRRGSSMTPGMIVIESRHTTSEGSADHERSSKRHRKSEGQDGTVPRGRRTIRYKGPDNLLYELNVPIHDDHQHGPVSETDEQRRYETNSNL